MIRALFIFLCLSWGALAENGRGQPAVVIMLDVNDTMLREVDRKEHGDKPGVQKIVYKPDPARLGRSLVGIDHYATLPDGRIETTLGLRPGMEPFFETLGPHVASGKVRIVLTSLADPARTKAVLEQLKIKDKTLKSWGVEMLEPSHFHELNGVKEIGAFRRALRLNQKTKVVAVDDDMHNFFATTESDAIVDVPAWTVPVADAHLDGLEIPNKVRHHTIFGAIADRVVLLMNNQPVTFDNLNPDAGCNWRLLLQH